MRWLQASVVALLATAGSAFAQNPFDGLDTRGRAMTDPAVYSEARARWLDRVQALPDNVDVLEGAADFFMIRERALSENFLERARALEPKNPKWPSKLALIHRQNASSGDLGEARLALVELERARELTPGNQRGWLDDLPVVAFEAGDFAKARAYAERLMAEATSANYGNAVHKSNLVLGRIAVREGRIGDAVKFLQASGATGGSPTLNSFGPNMLLAGDLLAAGQKDAVLAYFEQCRAFWKMGGEKLDRWSQEVKAGVVPNFGANLVY
jgi:hypothetical protein